MEPPKQDVLRARARAELRGVWYESGAFLQIGAVCPRETEGTGVWDRAREDYENVGEVCRSTSAPFAMSSESADSTCGSGCVPCMPQ